MQQICLHAQSPESTWAVVQRNQITKERAAAIKPSKTRALESRVDRGKRWLQRGLESSLFDSRRWPTSPQLVAKKIQSCPLPGREREWYQGLYRWEQHLFKPVPVKRGLTALIRRAHPHSNGNSEQRQISSDGEGGIYKNHQGCTAGLACCKIRFDRQQGHRPTNNGGRCSSRGCPGFTR